MSRTVLLLMAAVMALSACGIKRPLMRPKDIPAYEQKRARKMEKFAPAAEPPAQVPVLETNQPGTTSLEETISPMPPVGE